MITKDKQQMLLDKMDSVLSVLFSNITNDEQYYFCYDEADKILKRWYKNV